MVHLLVNELHRSTTLLCYCGTLLFSAVVSTAHAQTKIVWPVALHNSKPSERGQ